MEVVGRVTNRCDSDDAAMKFGVHRTTVYRSCAACPKSTKSSAPKLPAREGRTCGNRQGRTQDFLKGIEQKKILVASKARIMDLT